MSKPMTTKELTAKVIELSERLDAAAQYCKAQDKRIVELERFSHRHGRSLRSAVK